MKAVRARVHLMAGAVTYGHWCDWCAVPSQARAGMMILTDGGVQRIGTFHYCPECKREGADLDPTQADAHG